jgi:hypothetical protein
MNSKTQQRYLIKVQGRLDSGWSEWLDRGTMVEQEAGAPITTLVGVLDQSALRGVLNKIWDLNLTVISVAPVNSNEV